MLFRLVSAGTAYLADVRGTVDGALTLPVVQPILVVGDGTQIGDNQGRIVGGTPITTRQDWRVTTRTHTSSAQDVQLFGGPIFMEINRNRISSMVCLNGSGGALNVQVGSASGGSQIVASVSIPSGATPTDLTLATRFPPTQNLWARRVAGAGTGPFTFTVEGHRVAANP